MSEAYITRRGGSGGGGAGATLTVSAPAGVTAKITKDGKTKTKTVGGGVAVFSGLDGGTWMASISDATHDETTPVPVTVTTDYSVTLSFFTATINVTYPAGSTCTVSKGGITLSAPDTSGAWACTVPEAGTWTVTATDGTDTATETVEITVTGQCEIVELGYSLILFDNGDEHTPITGGWSFYRSNTNQITAAITDGKIGISISKNEYNRSANAYTTNAIDTSGYNTLLVHIDRFYSDASASPSRVGVAGYVPDFYLESNIAAKVINPNSNFQSYDFSNQDVLVDVSTVSVPVYVYINLCAYKGEGAGAIIEVSKVQLLRQTVAELGG